MSERLLGWHTILGDEGGRETPYMTRIWIGRLRLHIFYRGDADPDCHDHPWDFWTLALTPYVEEVALPDRFGGGVSLFRQIVPAWRWSFRLACHTHRVLGAWTGGFNKDEGFPETLFGKRIVTLVWRSKSRRDWGFLKNRDGKWCWTPWKDYVFRGGRNAPCAPTDGGGQ